MKMKKKKRVAIVADYFGDLGGVTNNLIHLVSALNSVGITPDIYAYSIDQNYEENIYKERKEKVGFTVSRMLKFEVKRFALYKPFLYYFIPNFNPAEYDFVYDFSGLYPPYDHEGLFFIYYDYWSEFEEAGWKTLYRLPYKLFLHGFTKRMFGKKMEFCSQSKFVQKVMKKNYGVNTELVYSPVSLKKFSSGKKGGRSGVVSLARFEPYKRQLEQVQVIGRTGIEFFVCGSYVNKEYYKKCVDFVKENKLANVHIKPFVPFEELKKIMAESKYFVHCFAREHFGLCTAEAISAGLIPIVPDCGGSVEIVPVPSLRFKEMSEIPGIIRELEKKSEGDIDAIRRKLKKHVEQYDESAFKEKMLSYLNS